MAANTLILQGRELEKLILEAEAHFKTSRDNIDVEILEEKKNIFGKQYKIKATYKYSPAIEDIERIIGSIEKDLEAAQLSQSNFDIADSNKDIMQKKIDCEYEVSISNNGMEAYLLVYPPVGGKEIDKDDIYKALEVKNVKNGIINEEIDKLVVEKRYNNRILVAKGKPAIDGEDAKIIYNFDISKDKKIHISEDGKVDYKELSLIRNVSEGDILATIVPATKGINGEDVFGNEIKARDGKQISIPRGKNVAVSEDGLQLVSMINGEVKLIDNKISVLPVYTVEGNVDNSTGNIKFVGKVVVKGNVLTGFSIDADDDVEVYGVVEGAVIKTKGNIILHRGIQGMNRGELVCEGDLIAKFIENSKVHAKGSIKTDAIMHSTVYCGKKLEVQGKKGLIVGGQVKASDEIKAKIIGSPMATVTELEVGINPGVRKKYEELKEEKDRSYKNLIKVTQVVDLLSKLNQKGELSDEKKEALNKSIILKLQSQKTLDSLEKEIKDIESYIEEISNGKIKVENIVYPGTKITIGSNSMYIRDQVQYVTFYRSAAEIKIGSYEP